MAGDLWDSTINQGSLKSSYPMLSGWNCDFYFGHGYDVIEENALNEKSCLEALRILITKADTEIGELEKDLKHLQVQIAAENEEVYELCCNLLKTRINSFNMETRSLRINGSIVGAELSMPGRPAPKAYEIMSNLLQTYIDKKDKKSATLTEESFLQVLKILIKKANTEIDELEKELEFLQTELAWAEHEEFSEIFCDVLREKIDFLDKSLRSLRSNDDNDMGLQLPMCRKPADKIQEMVEALLQKHFQGREQQPSEVAISDSRSDASAHPIELLTESREKRKFDPNISEVEESKENEAPTERSTSTHSSLELQDKRANNSKTIKPADAIVKVSSSDSFNFTSGFFNDTENSREQHITPMEESQVRNSSLDHVEKGILQNASQLTKAVAKYTNHDALRQPAVPEVRQPQLGYQKAIVVYDKKSHLNGSVKPKTVSGKGKFQTYRKSVQGQTLPSVESELQTPISKAKRQLKSDVDDDSATLNELIVWKPLKKPSQPDHCAKEHSSVTTVVEKEQWRTTKTESKDPILQLKRKRRHASSLPFSTESKVLAANNDDSVSPSIGTVIECKALQMIKSSPPAGDSSVWAIVPVPSAKFNFTDLKVPELRAIAKKRKLKKFHKLKKKDLIELLENPSCC